VEYLGPDLPIEDLVDYASYEHPAMIILSATQESAGLELSRVQEKLNRQRPAPLFGYGGRVFNLKPELRKKVPGIFLGSTFRESVEYVKSLLAGSGKGGRG
jgi:methanogenic corrinoid protein MtbC1